MSNDELEMKIRPVILEDIDSILFIDRDAKCGMQGYAALHLSVLKALG